MILSEAEENYSHHQNTIVYVTQLNNNFQKGKCNSDAIYHQDQPFTVKNPKLDSNSALAKKRRAKALPQLQVGVEQWWPEGDPPPGAAKRCVLNLFEMFGK